MVNQELCIQFTLGLISGNCSALFVPVRQSKEKNIRHTLVPVAWSVSHQCTTCSVILQEENVYLDLIFWNSAIDSVTKKWEVSHLNKLILISRYLGYDGTTNSKCSLASHLGHMGETASRYSKVVGLQGHMWRALGLSLYFSTVSWDMGHQIFDCPLLIGLTHWNRI